MAVLVAEAEGAEVVFRIKLAEETRGEGSMSTYKWTCGECGDSFEASSDLAVEGWAMGHRERHRVEKLPVDEQAAYYAAQIKAMSMMGRPIEPDEITAEKIDVVPPRRT
jgi:hypothetical protein